MKLVYLFALHIPVFFCAKSDDLTTKGEKLKEVTYFDLSATDLLETHCSAVSEKERFWHTLNKTCPDNYDPTCADPIHNPNRAIEYYCNYEFKHDHVVKMNSTEFFNVLKMRDQRKRNWCMLTMFYSHNCHFSDKLSKDFNKLPNFYKNLMMVAVDATQFTTLNFRYGVSGTPTVLLWINGIGVARMENMKLNMTGLNDFIDAHTNLKSYRWRPSVPIVEDEDRKEVVDEEPEGLKILFNDDETLTIAYTFTSFAVCIITLLYHFRELILKNVSVFTFIRDKLGQAACNEFYFLLYSTPPRIENDQQEDENPPNDPNAQEPLPDLIIDE